MSFAAWIGHHRRALLFVAFALAVAGLVAGLGLPVGLFPVTSFPRIRIEVNAGSRPAQQMLIDVTEPLEAAARAVPGALDVSSTTSRGTAQILVDFPWGWNMSQALLTIDAAFAQAQATLPPGTSYDAIQMSPNIIDPFIAYALISKKVSPAELRHLARYQIAPLLSGIAGVRRVGVLGGETPEVEVRVDPHRLAALGLTLAEVAKAISASNSITAVGRIEDNDLLYLAIDDNAFTSLRSVQDVVLRTGAQAGVGQNGAGQIGVGQGGGIVRLGDVARVTMGSVPQWLLIDNNGQPAVTFGVFQQDSADSLNLARQVEARLGAFMKTQPKSIHLVKWYDQTVLVRSSIAAVEEAILIGLVFAVLVILGFLRNWRVALVAMVVVPVSVLITVLVLATLGMSFNIMTLGGIAAAIGLLIDDVIVMIEHIARRAGAAPTDPEKPRVSVLAAAREFLSPLVGSSLATILIFVPLAFLSGVTGAFFKFLSLTMGSALIISFLLTLIIVPLLAQGLIDFAKWQDPAHGRETWLRRAHGKTLRLLFARPLLIFLGLAILIGAGYFAYGRVGTGFLPRMDEGGFVLDYQSAPGTSLTETDRELGEIEAILKKSPYVAAYSRRTGAGFGGDFVTSYQGDFVVRLIEAGHRPDIWKVMDEVTKDVTDQVPGVSFDTHQILGDMIGDMVGRRQPVVVKLSAKNPDLLGPAAEKVAAALTKVPGIEPASIDTGVVPAGDALEIHVDPRAAAEAGMTPAEIKAEVYHYLHGTVITRYLGQAQDVGVRLWLDPPGEKIYRDRLGDLLLRAPDGHFLSLKSVAKVAFVAGQPQITRDNLAQIVAVTAGTGGGASLGATIAAVNRVLQQPGLIPPGVTYTLGGAYRQQQLAVRGMIRSFVAAALAEIVLLLFLYESFSISFIVILSSLISTGAVFVGLWLTGVELNITAMMGMVMIIGIATEMAIFLVSEYSELAKTMPPHEALFEAALNRLRPILMSSLAMILALLPLGAAISGSGDQMLQPLAIAIIAGIVVQLPLVLLAMPVLIGLVTSRRGSRAEG